MSMDQACDEEPLLAIGNTFMQELKLCRSSEASELDLKGLKTIATVASKTSKTVGFIDVRRYCLFQQSRVNDAIRLIDVTLYTDKLIIYLKHYLLSLVL